MLFSELLREKREAAVAVGLRLIEHGIGGSLQDDPQERRVWESERNLEVRERASFALKLHGGPF